MKTKLSSDARSYFDAQKRNLSFFHFVIDRVLSADYVAYIAKMALDGKERDSNLSPSELARKQPGPSTKRLRDSRQELIEMFLSREVDNFQVYLVDIIRTALRKQPNMLKSSQEALSLEFVLEFRSTEELLHAVIERKVQSLSYEGFSRLRAWCLKKGIEIRIPDDSEELIVELVATRNIIAHNRGVVDQRYCDGVKNSKFVTNEIRTLGADDLFKCAELLGNIVRSTDEVVSSKFLIEVEDYICPEFYEGGAAREEAEQDETQQPPLAAVSSTSPVS